jgi:methyl coenzyme M reductase subunit C
MVKINRKELRINMKIDNIKMEKIEDLKKLIIKNRSIMPEVKGTLGIILFKIENKMELDQDEKQLFNEIVRYLNVS